MGQKENWSFYLFDIIQTALYNFSSKSIVNVPVLAINIGALLQMKYLTFGSAENIKDV